MLIPRYWICRVIHHHFQRLTSRRPETEAYTVQVAASIIQRYATNTPLRILDLCTGTGCIALLLHSMLSLHFSDLTIQGNDISPRAVSLAEENLSSNVSAGRLSASAGAQVRFEQADIFKGAVPKGTWDVVISNPPYVSSTDFDRGTERSVRRWEPKHALVPQVKNTASDSKGCSDTMRDTFYPRLLEMAGHAEATYIVMEVADMDQAKRVISQAMRTQQWKIYQIWRDWPVSTPSRSTDVLTLEGKYVAVRGEGHGRVVVLSR